ncbi:MAG TPA: CehA/McbA family metallohydrolase, partial [Polyangia bacterium]|nr:CehA/McbA family metallohydrolase [Polyangia bacterium]
SVDLAVPPGHYYVYATRGPFSSLDRTEVDLASGTSTSVTLQVESLASQILPTGVVSGDFHVHGGASFDSSIPDLDRVVSFLATGIDVIIATDHNVVTDYKSTLETLGATSSLVVIPGVEQTPNILWYDVPGDRFPKTLGHFNFWPLVPDFLQTRNGAPWAELREPGQVMDDMDKVFLTPATGVRQLNHPYLLAKLGRDQGYPQAIGYDPTKPIPATPTDGFTFAANALARAPGGKHRNIDWDVEEVMTGASRADWLRYRALWFSLLNQGFKRVGTANSDSHSLSIEQVGYPRNLVWGGHDQGMFDFDSFDADVRAGHVEGTNGPVLDVTIDDAGRISRPDMAPITVSPTATLKISVAAAPWIPVTEARVFVNGVFAHTFDLSSLFPSSDPFGTQVSTAAVSLQLATLLPAKGDAWLVVEAGLQQDTPPDTDGDGLPDLPDTALPGRPALDDSRFNLQAIAPGVWPTAFSNAFFLDLDGGGWTAPGLQ